MHKSSAGSNNKKSRELPPTNYVAAVLFVSVDVQFML